MPHRVKVKQAYRCPKAKRYGAKSCQGLLSSIGSGSNTFSLCTCWGTLIYYDVLIPVTQITSFVCKHTVGMVVCITNFGKQTGGIK